MYSYIRKSILCHIYRLYIYVAYSYFVASISFPPTHFSPYLPTHVQNSILFYFHCPTIRHRISHLYILPNTASVATQINPCFLTATFYPFPSSYADFIPTVAAPPPTCQICFMRFCVIKCGSRI